MKRIALAVLVAARLIQAHPADAGFIIDGNQLYEDCIATSEVSEARCIAYIDGVVDSLEILRATLKAPECLPAGTTGRQYHDVVVQWLAANPQERTHAAPMLIQKAVNQAWPACQH